MRAVHHLRRALLTVIAAAAVFAAIPGAALAAEPPTILTAGFDAHDVFYATWSLAPGTTYEQIDFATLPAPDRELPEFFLDGFADYDSCDEASCRRKTSYTGAYPLRRDRRYFVMVTANDGENSLPSAVWVIDDTKPLIPGDAKLGEGDGTNAPVAGKPFDGTGLFPPGVVPRASIEVLKKPKTISGLLRTGVRVRVRSSVAFAVETTLIVKGKGLGARSIGFATGGTQTIKTTAERNRASLRGVGRARVTLGVVVTLADGTQKTARRTFTVRR